MSTYRNSDDGEWRSRASFAPKQPGRLRRAAQQLGKNLARAIDRPIDSTARWLGFWDRNWSQEQFEVTFRQWLMVRVPYSLFGFWDRTFWRHCYEHEYQRYLDETGASGMNLSSGSGWAMFGCDITWRGRCLMIGHILEFERAQQTGRLHELGYVEC